MYIKQNNLTILYVYTAGTHWPPWFRYILTITAPAWHLNQPSPIINLTQRSLVTSCQTWMTFPPTRTSNCTLLEPNSSSMEYKIVKQATTHDKKKHFSMYFNTYEEGMTGYSVESHMPNEVKESCQIKFRSCLKLRSELKIFWLFT